jgi:uncharacterized protein YkwD
LKLLILLAAFAFSALCPAAAAVAERAIFTPTTQNFNSIPVTGSADFEACGSGIVAVTNYEYEHTIVVMTNQIRAEHGLPPLKRVERLDLAARYHVADMSVDDYFDHNSFNRDENNSLYELCSTWERIENYYDNWLALGENIAAGQNSPEMAMDGWMNSPDHKKNILSDSYWEIGVGYFAGSGTYREYWGQNFGRRNGVFPMVINLDALSTTSNEVRIYIYGDWSEMRLSNDGELWTDWLPFDNDITWTLPLEAGTHTVYAEMRRPGMHATTEDSIELIFVP